MLKLDAGLQFDREAVFTNLEETPWLLIPDLDLRLFQAQSQQVFCRSSIPTELDADFLIIERRLSSTHMQLVCLAGPKDEILCKGILSEELQAALSKVTRWSIVARDCLTRWLRESDDAGGNHQIRYRIVIGDSHRQSEQERATVRSLRTSVLRIRSFRWLLEKQSLYPELKAAN